MVTGYEVFWTDHALLELDDTVRYIERYWTEREVRNLFQELEHTIELISKNPELFPVSIEKSAVRRAVVATHNSLYYQLIPSTHSVELLSFFSNRQNPEKKNI